MQPPQNQPLVEPESDVDTDAYQQDVNSYEVSRTEPPRRAFSATRTIEWTKRTALSGPQSPNSSHLDIDDHERDGRRRSTLENERNSVLRRDMVQGNSPIPSSY